MMSSPSSPDLSPLDYQVWGNAGVLSQAAREDKNSSWVFKCTSVDLSALPENAIDNSVKDYHTRLQADVSAGDGHFEEIMW